MKDSKRTSTGRIPSGKKNKRSLFLSLAKKVVVRFRKKAPRWEDLVVEVFVIAIPVAAHLLGETLRNM